MDSLDTPVLLITFNRIETTKKVLEAIRSVRPKKLYVASDGPRANRADDLPRIEMVRKACLESVDWDCEVKTLFREKNLGCKLGVSSAITWLLDNEEEGIILEDDCLPSASFFSFCEELLKKYRNDSRVSMISGDFFGETEDHNSSYYFTKHFHIWGWATWRRAWSNYDIDMKRWPDKKDELRRKVNFSSRIWQCYANAIDSVYRKEVDTWDYQWTYSCWLSDCLAICPTSNLISNIGFSPDATHTKNSESILASLPRHEIAFPLVHPNSITRDIALEALSEKIAFPGPASRMLNRIKQTFKSFQS